MKEIFIDMYICIDVEKKEKKPLEKKEN